MERFDIFREREKKTRDQVAQEVLNKHNGNIELVGNYMDANTKTLFRCNKCGNEWMAKPNNIIRGKGCQKCSGNEKKTRDQVSKEVLDKHEGRVELVGDYVNARTKSLFHCNICGNEWMTQPSDILRGCGCPRCGGTQKKTRDQVAQEVLGKHEGRIELVGDYINARTKALFHCNVCGNEWEAKPNNILGGQGCPRCSFSHGEEYITSWLEKNWSKEDWTAQKKFEDLKGTGNRCLSYDFYIPSKNLCIEMQGMQHYTPITYFGGEATFINQQEHDRRKKQYCQEHGMTLLEIRHDEIDMIDDILDKALNS